VGAHQTLLNRVRGEGLQTLLPATGLQGAQTLLQARKARE
jgi:hypothetical protein